VKDVDVQIVWNPPWDPRTMASEDVKMALGIW
jgi:metal-sulfur cluster biosynthetic enzyme